MTCVVPDELEDEEPVVEVVEEAALELETDPMLFAVPIGGDC